MKLVFVALLLVLHLLTSQVVDAQNVTSAAPGTTTVTVNHKNGCGRMDAFSPPLLLLPLLLLAAPVIHGWLD